MNYGKLLILVLAIFISVSLAPFPKVSAQVASPQVVPSQPIYNLWGTGGKANFTASRLNVNLTYFAWLQRPNDASTRLIGVTLSARSGTASFQVLVAATDPPGTYLISLSTSSSSDTGAAIAHFGVGGIDRATYRRTDSIKISGGGYTPNSTISVIIRSLGQTTGNLSLVVNAKGEFSNPYRISPSIPLGLLTVSVIGSTFDTGQPVTTGSTTYVVAAPLAVTELTQPPLILERTSTVAVNWRITYPDGSPVTTSTQNSTRVLVASETAGGGTEVQMQNSDPTKGVWTATWTPSSSEGLGAFRFIVYPTDFDDSYGNIGRGTAIASSAFKLTAAHTGLAVQGNSTIERTLAANIVIIPTYHDGKPFANVTRASGTLTDAAGTAHRLVFNGSLNGLVGYYKTNASTPLGSLRLIATVTDIFGNTATGNMTIQIVPATIHFAVYTVPQTQRTTMLNATAVMTYPDGTPITQDNMPLGFNATFTEGNFTWTHQMLYNPITKFWRTGFVLAQNATVGNYALTMNATDPYQNFGAYSGFTKVVPATFIIQLPRTQVKANPHTLVYVTANVAYPNGTALTPTVGGAVAASLTNSSGTFAYPMDFNATDQTWLLVFQAPDPGFKFGLTITFSFAANDQYGNAGSASKAFELDVGAGVESLVLATVFGAVVPTVLVGWAIATVTGRRRKHKP